MSVTFPRKAPIKNIFLFLYKTKTIIKLTFDSTYVYVTEIPKRSSRGSKSSSIYP